MLSWRYLGFYGVCGNYEGIWLPCGARRTLAPAIPQHQDAGCHQGVSQEGPDGHEIHEILQVEEKSHNSCGGRGGREGRKNINTAEYAHPSSVISSTAHVWLLLRTWQGERRELGASRGEGRQDLLGTHGLVSPCLSWTATAHVASAPHASSFSCTLIAHSGATRRCCRLGFLIFSGSLLPSVDSRLHEGKNVREKAVWKTAQGPGCRCRRLSCFTAA